MPKIWSELTTQVNVPFTLAEAVGGVVLEVTIMLLAAVQPFCGFVTVN